MERGAAGHRPPAGGRLPGELNRQPGVAAAQYCAAARDGSVEGSIASGRLYLMGRAWHGTTVAITLLSISGPAWPREGRPAWWGPWAPASAARLPDHGAAPVVAEAGCERGAFEVVGRFVKALPADKRRHALLVQKLAPRFKGGPAPGAGDRAHRIQFRRGGPLAEERPRADAVDPRHRRAFRRAGRPRPEQNVRGGLAYLRWLLSQFKGDVALAAAAYNAGEGNVMRYKGVPPFAETQEYVRRILTFYRAPRHAEGLAP